MKAMQLAGVLVLSMTALAGCATQAEAVRAAPDDENVDLAYVASVEAAAREHFVDVRWVNPPLKHPADQKVTSR
ncbi:MAG: hypothetical protein ACTHKZ_02590 [Lysobacteraceae bacterium]